MKRKILSFALAIVMILSVLAILGSCDDKSANDSATSAPETTAGAQKLNAPVVTLTGDVATWEANPNADKFEISIGGDLSYVENTVTSKTLANGQTFKVRAVGDGNKYTTSDWSNSVIYTDGSTVITPNKLSAPIVSISSSGLASWNAVPGAVGYSYKINGAGETVINETSVQLSDGQSITVKAVGDGINNADSDYSAAKTYTAGVPNPPSPPSTSEDEPDYLGIFASNNEPSQADGLPGILINPQGLSKNAGESRSFDEAIAEYYSDNGNHLDANYPEASNFDLYSRAGETVYVQIWLNNPSQHTILSMKLNGTKYQVGGGLSSFFIEKDGQHYNCVYVAVTIPAGAHTSIDYTVSDIEYIADTFINADGTDQFMNDNDTVSIGLPYSPAAPSVSEFDVETLTYNSLFAKFNLGDTSLATASGAWIGVAVYDGYNVLLNKKITAGSNSVEIDGLVENTDYSVIVYLYGDIHDGNGVCYHPIYIREFTTESAIDLFEVTPEYYANYGYDGIEEADSGLAINVDMCFTSGTATIDRLEIYLDDRLVHIDNEFRGYGVVEDLLAGTEYLVRVYYSDNEYTEHYAEEYVTTGTLEKPTVEFKSGHAFVTAVAFLFDYFENGWNGVAIAKDVEIRLFKNCDELYNAYYILQLCDDPQLFDKVKARYEEAQRNGDWALASKIYHEEYSYLEYADYVMKNGEYSEYGYDKASWQALFDSMSATYTFSDEDLFENNGVAYLIVRDFFGKFSNDYSYEITANVNFKDGRGFVRTVLDHGSGDNLAPLNSSDNYMSFDFEVDGYNVTVNPSCRINYEDSKLAIVSYTIGLYKNNELIDTLYTFDKVDWARLDEEAWIESYVLGMKGEAILPEESVILAYLDWLVIFEKINALEIRAEDDYTGGGNGDVTVEGGVIIEGSGGNMIIGGGRGEKNIANLAERELLKVLMQYDYPESYEYRTKTRMLEAFSYDRDYYDIISGCDTDDEKLLALIDCACNSTVISVLDDYVSGLYHYLTWIGNSSDSIFVNFKSAIENYIEENDLTPNVDWNEVYRRRMMFEDFEAYYPFGFFDKVELTIDPDDYVAGEYYVAAEFRHEDYEEDYYKKDYCDNSIMIYGPLPTPAVDFVEGRHLHYQLEVENFWEYTVELEIMSGGEYVYQGNYNDFDSYGNPLAAGCKIRMRAVVNDGVNTFYEDSLWSEWYTFEGIKLGTPEIGEFSLTNGSVSINYYDENATALAYTINNGAESRAPIGETLTIVLYDGDVLKVRAIAPSDGAYVSSDWATYTCEDSREVLAVPANVRIDTDSGCLVWDAVDGASSYYIEITFDGETNTTRFGKTSFSGIKPGATYRVRAMPKTTETHRPGAWSEYVTYVG